MFVLKNYINTVYNMLVIQHKINNNVGSDVTRI